MWVTGNVLLESIFCARLFLASSLAFMVHSLFHVMLVSSWHCISLEGSSCGSRMLGQTFQNHNDLCILGDIVVDLRF